MRVFSFNLKEFPDSDLISSFLVEKRIDVAAFQEFYADQQSREKLIRSLKIVGYIEVSLDCKETIFIKKDLKIKNKEHIAFTSTQQRKGVCIYYLEHDDIEFCIVNTQLENGGTGGGIRKNQIKELENILSNRQRFIIAADTNVMTWQIELNKILSSSSFLDSWREKGRTDNEYTDSECNRLDRILYKIDDKIKCISHEVYAIGNCKRKCVVVEFSINL